jgi:hypothetical protein
MSGIFSTWQPIYAEYGIATFPVAIEGKNKRPMNKGYQRTGLRGSAELAKKFTEANAFGMILGRRNNILLVDVDTKDERVLEDALSTYGDTPIVSRTATGGGFHAWYRYSDEAWKNHSDARRAIRPDPTKPFDFLAGGMAVAPSSAGRKRPSGIVQMDRVIDTRKGCQEFDTYSQLTAPLFLCLPATKGEGPSAK